MVTRRDMLLGSAAALGVVGVGSPALAGTVERRPQLAATLRQQAASGFSLPGDLFCPVPFMSRAAWGADESWRFPNGYEDWPIELYPTQVLTVHHTGFAASSDPAETVRTIYRQQALPKSLGGLQGWGDIGYHLLIDDDGVVYEGRYSGSDQYPVFVPNGLMVTGAHVLGYNTGNIGVCLLGYLNDAPPSAAAQDSLVVVLAYLAAAAAIDPLATVSYANPVNGNRRTVRGVVGHRDWAATDCPGHALYPLLGQIRQAAANAMPSQPEPTQSSGSAEPSPSPTASPMSSSTLSPAPSATSAPPTTASQTQPQPTTQAPAQGGARGERGGDEYVAQARIALPSQFPTVRPKPKPTLTPTPTPTVDGSASAVRSSAAPAPTDARAGARASDSDGLYWGVTATGLTVAAGVLGVWWLRQRRLASVPSTATEAGTSLTDASVPTLSSADDSAPRPAAADELSTQPATPSMRPPAPDGLAAQPPADEPPA